METKEKSPMTYSERVRVEAMVVTTMEKMVRGTADWYIALHRDDYNKFVEERVVPVLRAAIVPGILSVAGAGDDFGEVAVKAFEESVAVLFVTEQHAETTIAHFKKIEDDGLESTDGKGNAD